jgi:ribose transport system substrate-binding protein
MTHPWTVTLMNDMELWAEKSGVDFVWTDANNDSADQLNDIRDLLAKDPDLLFAFPLQEEPLAPIAQWCLKAKVPLITLDRRLAVDPDGRGYVTFIGADLSRQGYQNMTILAEKLFDKYGDYVGNVVELRGTIGSSADNAEHRGTMAALEYLPGIKLVASQSGDYARAKGLTIMENWLKMYPKGQIDGVICNNDEMALGAIQAIKEAGRTELLGWVTGVNAQREALQAILDGEILCSNMNGPYYGETAFKIGMAYLKNGEVPPKYVPLPIPQYRADSDRELRRAKMAYDYCIYNDVQYPPIRLWWDLGKKVGLKTPKY